MSIIDRILGYLNLKRVTTTEALALAPRQLSGRWEKATNENGLVLSYVHICLCSTERKYGPTEATVQEIHKCGSCGRSFSLLHSLVEVGADGKVDPAALQLRLSNLSTKLVARAATPQRLIQQVGDQPISEFYQWSGRQDAVRDRAFDAGDPGYTNLF